MASEERFSRRRFLFGTGLGMVEAYRNQVPSVVTQSERPSGPNIVVETFGEDAAGTDEPLRVLGTATHPDGIDSVSVFLEGSEVENVDFDGETQISFTASVRDLTGGQRYGGSAVLVTTGDERHRRIFISDYVPHEPTAQNASPTVGVHYYPWYGPDRHWELGYIDQPVLGEYDSRNENVIRRHIQWALDYGIDFFSMSWWGQDSWEDTTIQEHYLQTDLAQALDFLIFYESSGSLEKNDRDEFDFDDSENRAQLKEDFEYLSENYMSKDNYFTVDGKPVVLFWATSRYIGDVVSAFEEARNALDREVYLIVDFANWSVPTQRDRELLNAFDAVTTYVMYRPFEDINTRFPQRMGRWYASWLLAAKETNADFIPSTLPGYNNSEAAGGNPSNTPLVRNEDLFERVTKEARRYLDPRIDTIFVTSFNEWHERTQIEPAEGYGTTYLETLRDLFSHPFYNYRINEYVQFSLKFSETVAEGDISSSTASERRVSFAGTQLKFVRSSGAEVEVYDIGTPKYEPTFTCGVYDVESGERGSRRWLGGPEARTNFYATEQVLAADELRLSGKPAKAEVSAEVFVEGTKTGTLTFDTIDHGSFSVSLDW